jgi:hypothetical protein
MRSGTEISSCLQCPNGTFSDPGAASCAQILASWPMNDDSKTYRGEELFRAPAYTTQPGIGFTSDTVVNRTRRFMSLSGGKTDYVVVQQGDCAGLPLRDFSVSLWVRVDGTEAGGYGRTGLIGCFQSDPTGSGGWFLGTTANGRSFAFVMRSESAAVATLIADVNFVIELGTWCVCVCVCVWVYV